MSKSHFGYLPQIGHSAQPSHTHLPVANQISLGRPLVCLVSGRARPFVTSNCSAAPILSLD
jgi:hypothetical protein